MLFRSGFLCTVSNTVANLEAYQPTTFGVLASSNTPAVQLIPTSRTSTNSTGNVLVTPAVGSMGMYSFANQVVPNTINLSGLGLCSSDIQLTNAAIGFRNTISVGSQLFYNLGGASVVALNVRTA